MQQLQTAPLTAERKNNATSLYSVNKLLCTV